MNRLTRALFILLLISTFFLLFTAPITEGDIFWHIKTGEWMWQHKSLMSEDPFTYTSQKEDPLRPHSSRYDVILKGYWLSQLIYYSIWSLFGFPGVVILRACTFVAIMLVLYLWMRKKGVDIHLAVIFLFLIGYVMKDLNDRPQNFSFLFFPLTAILLEYLRPPADRDSTATSRLLSGALPLLMLVWANMHGGYITGVALIVIFMLSEWIAILYRRLREVPGPSPVSYRRFFIICFISVLATFINPTLHKTFVEVFRLVHSGTGFNMVVENWSPIEYGMLVGNYKPTFFIAVILTVAVMMLRIQYIPLSRSMALLLFGVSALLAQRNIPFFLGLLPFTAIEFSKLLRGRFGKALTTISILVLLIVMAVFVSDFRRNKVLKFDVAWSLFPEGAVRFMTIVKPVGNIFNLSEWGGYMMLAMPEYKVFDDGRRLMDDIEIVNRTLLLSDSQLTRFGVPRWKATLNAFGIDIIIIPPVNWFLGSFTPLTAALYIDNDFSLVYQDASAVVYLRHGSGNDDIIKTYSMPRELPLYQAMRQLSRPDLRPSARIEREEIRRLLEATGATTYGDLGRLGTQGRK